MLAALLDRTIDLIWPRRGQQEALLDLGEHKNWHADDRRQALEVLSTWLTSTGVVDGVGPPFAARMHHLPAMRAAALTYAAEQLEPPMGVSQVIARLAPLVGSAPKTLANSLSTAWSPARNDHRWLLALARLRDDPLEDLPFQRRSLAAQGRLLARLHAHVELGQPDAADALFVVSLIVLWQRRRPSDAARANRQRRFPRRATPLPVAALAGSLLSSSQFDALLGRADPALARLVFEAALTVALLEARVTRRTSPSTPARWPNRLQQALEGPRIATLLEEHAAIHHLRHRLAIMEAWRGGHGWPAAPAEIAHHPHVRLGAALASIRLGATLSPHVEDEIMGDWEGRAMLAPIIQERLTRRDV